ncbi:UNVERIFIED_ORG: hypothetical protein ABIC43_004897 [Variovorax guangxiensis]
MTLPLLLALAVAVVDRREFAKEFFQKRQMTEELAAERVVRTDRMKHTIYVQEQ